MNKRRLNKTLKGHSSFFDWGLLAKMLIYGAVIGTLISAVIWCLN
jgi:hypothetical protein